MSADGVRYRSDLDGITPAHLNGFFVGWPVRPSPERLLRSLASAHRRAIALDEDDRVVGFVIAIGEGVLCASIPLLEVLPEHQGRGIGTALMRRILAELEGLYMVDLACDPELQAFYERFGFRPLLGMGIRRPEALSDGE
jgi:GNAT superfamily N-acetyltransferase